MQNGSSSDRTWKLSSSAIALLAILAPASTFAVGPADVKAIDKIQAESGRVWYDKYCTSCHGAGGAPGSAVFAKDNSPVDLRRYVARHSGRFPAAQWIAVVEQVDIRAPHAGVWEQIRRDQEFGTSAQAAAARGIVFLIAEYVISVQQK